MWGGPDTTVSDRGASVGSLVPLRPMLLMQQAALERAPLETLPQLTLCTDGITDLAPLRRAVRLEGLVLDELAARDLSPIVACTRLEKLSIYDCPVDDFAALGSLRALRCLAAGDTRFDLGCVPAALPPWLVDVSLYVGSRDPDLSYLGALSQLERLSVVGGRIDGAWLAPLANLRTLQLTRTRTADLSFVGALPQLEDFWSTDNGVSDLRPLARLARVKRLLLDHNDIDDASPLRSLDTLERLGLSDNQIVDLPPLSLPRLAVLALGHNQIADLSPLVGLRALTELSLQHNQVRDLRPLGSLAALRVVRLEGNPIGDPAPLRALPSLASAWLSPGASDRLGPAAFRVFVEDGEE